jgi:hypothetical protein
MRAGYRKTRKATDLQQALYSWVIYGRYYISVRKADLKPRDLYEVLGGIEELKSFIGIIGRPPPPVYSSIII